jgi:hypothetical protein
VIVKAEHTAQGANPRFLVVNVPGDPQELYEDRPRGNVCATVTERRQIAAEKNGDCLLVHDGEADEVAGLVQDPTLSCLLKR